MPGGMTNPKEIKFKQLAILKRNLMDLQVQAAKFPQHAAELQPKIEHVQGMIDKIESEINLDDETNRSRADDRYNDKRAAEQAAMQEKIARAKQIDEAQRKRHEEYKERKMSNPAYGGSGAGGASGAGGTGGDGGGESYKGMTQDQWAGMTRSDRQKFLASIRLDPQTGAIDATPKPWWMTLGYGNEPDSLGATSTEGIGGQGKPSIAQRLAASPHGGMAPLP